MNPVQGSLEPDARPTREVRASFNEKTIRIYQAYSPEIAVPALAAQKFLPPFKTTRMTWIKPSFIWMMYRSGWAGKSGQEYILGIDILRSGFEWALANSCLSHFIEDVHPTHADWENQIRDFPVRIQWDPERTIRLQPLPWRAIQIGLGPQSVPAYISEWITRIDDVTPLAKKIESLVKGGEAGLIRNLIPTEIPYPLPDSISKRIGCVQNRGTPA